MAVVVAKILHVATVLFVAAVLLVPVVVLLVVVAVGFASVAPVPFLLWNRRNRQRIPKTRKIRALVLDCDVLVGVLECVCSCRRAPAGLYLLAWSA